MIRKIKYILYRIRFGNKIILKREKTTFVHFRIRILFVHWSHGDSYTYIKYNTHGKKKIDLNLIYVRQQ